MTKHLTPAHSTRPGMTAPAASPPLPYDPELLPVIREIGERPALTPESIPATRTAIGAGALDDDTLRAGGELAWAERAVVGRDGNPDVTLMIGRPADATPAERLPVLYYVHGGGLIAGSRRHLVSDVLEWTRTLRTVTVSVEYRLAPEHPYPAPLEDCYAGLLWTAEHAEELGADPDRIVLVGASAGGGLAAGLALLARDRRGPATMGQILLSPMLDDRNDTPSSRQMENRGLWDRASNATGWNAYLDGAAGGPEVSPYAAPARAEDLMRLSPAYLDVGSAETFRDETVGYAGRLWQSGVQCELHVWPGGFHGFDEFAPGTALARRAKRARRQWLRGLLAT